MTDGPISLSLDLQTICFFASWTRVSWSTIIFWNCTQARRVWQWATFIMHNFVVLEPTTKIVSTGSKLILGRGFPRCLSSEPRFVTSTGALRFGLFESNAIMRCLNQKQWHESKVKHLIWDDYIMYAKVAWARVIKLIKISTYLAKPSSQAESIKLGVLGTSSLKVLEWNPLGTRKNHVYRKFATLVTWGLEGWPWLGGMGVVLEGVQLPLLLF